MTDKYFIVPSDWTAGGLFWIIQEGDVLPLDSFQTWCSIGQFQYNGPDPEYQGKTILLIHSGVPSNSIEALAEEVGGDPMTIEATEQLRISKFLGGSSIPELKERLLEYWGFELPDTKEADGETVPFLISSSMGPGVKNS
ncbi:hypothetical protein C4588_03285 [Candidatus Parcubacteria bacterium]|jgi:hypothetical protein|nr:MAG: hypothetical protein C4588_03285 [Candidatus Parcubacteria bacterium]